MQETQEQPQVEAPTQITQPDLVKVIINVIRDRKQNHDYTVTFTVKDESQASFKEVLSNFLKELPATTKIKINTADDSVTKQPARVFIDVDSMGMQQQVGGRLQQYIQVFQPYCTDVK